MAFIESGSRSSRSASCGALSSRLSGEARAAVAAYVETYHHRPHSGLGYRVDNVDGVPATLLRIDLGPAGVAEETRVHGVLPHVAGAPRNSNGSHRIDDDRSLPTGSGHLAFGRAGDHNLPMRSGSSSRAVSDSASVANRAEPLVAISSSPERRSFGRRAHAVSGGLDRGLQVDRRDQIEG